jgi:ROK family protein
MALLAFDMGGTAVKYGLFRDRVLEQTNSFPTPATWEEMKKALLTVRNQFSDELLEGVAFSSPGSVDSEAGIIYGSSAIPYIHRFEIVKELEETLGLPVSIENDANCAALAEVEFGVAKSVRDVVFFIIGSGIGGALVLNRKLHKGNSLFGGEFGRMQLRGNETLSVLASPVQSAKRYAESQSISTSFSGKDLFSLADQGVIAAQNAVSDLYDSLALGIYNVLVVLDPELVVLGGGLSKQEELLGEIDRRVRKLLENNNATELKFQLERCQYFNDANLLGAVAHFQSQGASNEAKKE